MQCVRIEFRASDSLHRALVEKKLKERTDREVMIRMNDFAATT